MYMRKQDSMGSMLEERNKVFLSPIDDICSSISTDPLNELTAGDVLEGAVVGLYITVITISALIVVMSIANFYFLILAISYLSISSSWTMHEEHIVTACG